MYVEELDFNKKYFICEVVVRWMDYYIDNLPVEVRVSLATSFERAFCKALAHTNKLIDKGFLRVTVSMKERQYYENKYCDRFEYGSFQCKKLLQKDFGFTEDETFTIKGSDLLAFEELFFNSKSCKEQRENLIGEEKKLYIHQLIHSIIPINNDVQSWIDEASNTTKYVLLEDVAYEYQANLFSFFNSVTLSEIPLFLHVQYENEFLIKEGIIKNSLSAVFGHKVTLKNDRHFADLLTVSYFDKRITILEEGFYEIIYYSKGTSPATIHKDEDTAFPQVIISFVKNVSNNTIYTLIVSEKNINLDFSTPPFRPIPVRFICCLTQDKIKIKNLLCKQKPIDYANNALEKNKPNKTIPKKTKNKARSTRIHQHYEMIHRADIALTVKGKRAPPIKVWEDLENYDDNNIITELTDDVLEYKTKTGKYVNILWRNFPSLLSKVRKKYN